MFKTQSNYEFVIPALGALGDEPGVKHWQAFELVLNNFWFVVEFLVKESDGHQYWKTMMVSDLNSVLGLVSSDEILEHRINMVIPTHHSEVEQLQMKVVVAIYSAQESGQQSMTIYVSSDGLRFVDSALGYNEEQAENKETLYSKNNINIKKNVPYDE